MENNNSNSNNEKQGPNLNPTDLLSLSNHHSLWNRRSNPSSSPSSPAAAAGEMEEEEPSHLNTLNSSGLFQHVSADKMSVEYVGTQQHGFDVGAAQADCPAPTRNITYYFEMTVTNAGDKGRVSIGFTCRDYNLRRQPG